MSQVNLLFEMLRHQAGVLISVDAAQGSVPREKGAWMAVFADTVLGTIGGGHLEFQAIEQARRRLACREDRGATMCNGLRWGQALGNAAVAWCTCALNWWLHRRSLPCVSA